MGSLRLFSRTMVMVVLGVCGVIKHENWPTLFVVVLHRSAMLSMSMPRPAFFLGTTITIAVLLMGMSFGGPLYFPSLSRSYLHRPRQVDENGWLGGSLNGGTGNGVRLVVGGETYQTLPFKRAFGVPVTFLTIVIVFLFTLVTILVVVGRGGPG